MWKVVIADDEGVILQGLKKLIDWKKVDVELVGEARDGQQLKKVIEQTDPDIVIADIMMPHMTGLEVIRWYNEMHSHAKFIFVSGYQEFTYAKEALQTIFLLESALVSVRMWHQIWLMILLNVLIWCASLFIIRSVRNYGERHLSCAKTTVHCISWECSPVERKILSWKPT